MRVVYLGTPDFAIEPLKALLENEDLFNVVAVVTNPDKPVGRKQVLTAPPVKEFAVQKGIPVYQYSKIRLEGVEDLIALKPDVLITCAFGQILSKEILDIAPFGVINVHASLLPKYRGASPIHYAILNGEKETGITIMKTDEGIDTGDIILSESIPIGERETCGELFDRLSVLGGKCLITALKSILNGTAKFYKQDDSKATKTGMIKKSDALILWDKSAKEVVNQIRAFNPSPVSFTFYNGEQIKIYSAKLGTMNGNIGEILDSEKKIEIGCKDGSVIIEKLQKAGGKPMLATDFLRGNRLEKGGFLG